MRPVFAQKLSPCSAVDVTIHPLGSSLDSSYWVHREIDRSCHLARSFTCKDRMVNKGIARAKFQTLGAAVIHFQSLKNFKELLKLLGIQTWGDGKWKWSVRWAVTALSSRRLPSAKAEIEAP